MTITTKIFIILNGFIALFILINLTYRLIKIIQKQKKVDEIYNELTKAIHNKNLAKETLTEEVIKLFENEVSKKVIGGTIWEGMPAFLLLISLGKPKRIEDILIDNKIQNKWIYGAYNNIKENTKYWLEIFIENEEIINWNKVDHNLNVTILNNPEIANHKFEDKQIISIN